MVVTLYGIHNKHLIIDINSNIKTATGCVKGVNHHRGLVIGILFRKIINFKYAKKLGKVISTSVSACR